LLFNLSSATAVTTQYTPTDGTLAANTCKDGLFGNMYRAEYTTTGTYAGNTNVRIDLIDRRTNGVAMTRRESETWEIIGAFVIVCALLTALIIVL